MKRYIYIYIAFALLTFTSCDYKEKELFSKKPSERSVNVLQTYKDLLETPNTYWVLTSYPGVNNTAFWAYPYNPTVFATERDYPRYPRSIGGYSTVLKFGDGMVTASSEVNANNDESSSYFSYTTTEGPTLSFETYNSSLHHFSYVTNRFPTGRGGETEFLILKEENGVLMLRGRKSNNLATLRKLEGDRETFLNKLRENSNTLKNKALMPITVNGTEVTLKFFSSYRQLAFLWDNNQKYDQRAFAITEKGFKLYEPITINGVTFSEFYINDTKTGLTTADGTISTNFVNAPFVPTHSEHKISLTNGRASSNLVKFFNSRRKAIIKKFHSGYTLSSTLTFNTLAEGNDGAGVSSLYADVNGFMCYYELEFVGVAGAPNQVEILFRDVLEYKYNAIFYFSDVKNLCLQLAKFSPYTVEDQLNGYYLFTSARDNTVWFYVAQ